ncbi:MAG: ABC transporter substrate-binding protein [Proteobacteria bacterium]|nr:ABC transporter substrate-binding protein [Pseudomonadota bacterium]MBS0546649.1 ABC transporter substrate-binding protein [Pseudomonadota bacterium]
MKRTVALAIAAMLAATGSASAQEKFTFALNWFAVGDHAAYWVALDKGYYKAKGLDVTLENSKGSGDSMAKVDTGRADAGLADVAAVVPFLSKGGTIKVVGMVFDKTPLNIFSLKGKPLTKPKDLEGASLGSPPGDAQRQVFPAFAKLTGIDAKKVTWVNIEPAAKIAALVEKRMDGVSDYTTGLPLYEKAGGKGNIVMMKWADFGFDLYAMSIMASAKTMKDKPKQLKAFLEASYMGWRDVMADPDAALAIQKKHVPELDLSTIKENMAMGLELMKTDQYRKGGIGSIDDKRMCASVDLMNNYMSMAKKVECKDVYTQEFFTKVEMPK